MLPTAIVSHGRPHVNPYFAMTVGFPSQPVTLNPSMIHPQIAALSDRIRELVASSGMTQAEIGRALGVGKSTVNKWVKGERTPTMQNLIELAELLGIEMKEIWEGAVSVPSTPEQRLMIEQMARMTPEQQQALLTLAATMGVKHGGLGEN